MSISSDVFITEEEARQKVAKLMMIEQEELIKLAIKGMNVFELESYLNRDSEMYFFNVEGTGCLLENIDEEEEN